MAFLVMLVLLCCLIVSTPATANAQPSANRVDGHWCVSGETPDGESIFGCQINGVGYAVNEYHECWKYDGAESSMCTINDLSILLYYWYLYE